LLSDLNPEFQIIIHRNPFSEYHFSPQVLNAGKHPAKQKQKRARMKRKVNGTEIESGKNVVHKSGETRPRTLGIGKDERRWIVRIMNV